MNASDFTNEQMNKPDPIPAQPTPAAGGAKKDAPKLITYVFEIVDEKLWDEQRNPMYRDNAAIPGLKCVGMSVGDLLSMAEAFEDAAPEAYETAHNEHVMKHLNSGAHASPRGKPETTP